MTAGRILIPTVIAVLAVFTLAAIWRHEWLGPDSPSLADVIGGSLSVAVVVAACAMLALWFCHTWRGRQSTPGHAAQYQANYDAIPEPYPPTYQPNSVTGFRYACALHLMRLAERLPGIPPEQQYIVAQDFTVCYTVNGREETITVPSGTLTDLASVPWLFHWYVGRVGPHLEAAIVHDYLYVAWQFHGESPSPERMKEMRRFADDLMLAAMQAAGMGCKAQLIYRAIRCGGRGVFFGRNPEPLVLDLRALPKQVSGPPEGASPIEAGT